MNAKSTSPLPARALRFGIWGTLLATGTLIQNNAAAQTVIANPVPTIPLQTQEQQNQPGEMQVFQPAGLAAENTLPQIFQYGPLQLHPHFDYRLMYGNGIQATPGNSQSTIVQELSPGLKVDLGSHWALDYTPTFRFYSSSQFKDTVDHSVALTGGVEFDAWKFGLSHSSQFTSAPLAQTGSQTDQSTHATTLSASRVLSSKMSADLSLNQQINLVSGFQDSYDWNTMDWINYQFWPRLNIGIGGGAGYVLVNDNSGVRSTNNLDQTYEQLQMRANWRATEKISFQVSGGFQDRQFMTSGSSDSLNPVFSASIQYQPFEVTQISLTASRTETSSDYYLAAQQTEITIVGVNVNQRLFRKFNLGLGVAYNKTDYNTSAGAVPGNAVNRSDDQISFNARLSHAFFKRGTWSIFYQYSDNQSSQQGFSYQSNQTGFEVSYRF